jgi:hypothetical protein
MPPRADRAARPAPLTRPLATARAWWEQADPDLRRYTRSVSIAIIAGLLAYVAVLWDFGVNPFRTALGGSDFSNFYDIQTRQFFQGHLDVPVGELGLEAFAQRGHEYMYFPPGPSLLRAPFFLFTDALDDKFTAFSMLAAWFVTALMTALLMWRVRLLLRGRVHLGKAEAVGFAILLFTLVSGSVVLYLASLPFVYHEAYAWAIAMAIGAAFCTVGLIHRPSTRGAVAAGAFTMGAILSRTTAGWACAGGLILAALWFWAGRSDQPTLPRRWVPTLLAAALVPLGVGVALNWAKFRHPYIFPLEDQVWTSMSAQRRAALAANGGDLVSPSVLPATLVGYFRPDGIRFTTLFPYITLPAEVPRNYGGSFLDQMYRTGSVVTFMPLLVLLTAWGVITTFRRTLVREARALRIPLLAVGVIPGAIMFYGYIAMRYTAEFIPLFALASAIGYIDLARRLEARPRLARPALAGLALLALFGFAANLAVSITSARAANPGTPLSQYVRLQAAISKRTPGDPIDDLVHEASTLPRAAPADRLQIVDDCRALFLGSGEPLAPWIPVEVQALEWEIDLTDPPTKPTTITLAEADGLPGSQIRVEFDGEGQWRGLFPLGGELVKERWRPVPEGRAHLRLFPFLREQNYILVDLGRPARGLVDLPTAVLDQTPFRHQLVFRSVTDDATNADIPIVELETPRPPICVHLQERAQPAGA